MQLEEVNNVSSAEAQKNSSIRHEASSQQTKDKESKHMESQFGETATPDFEVAKGAENDGIAEASVSEFKLACSAAKSQTRSNAFIAPPEE